MRIADELVTIAISSDDDDLVTDINCLIGHGGDHVVGFKA